MLSDIADRFYPGQLSQLFQSLACRGCAFQYAFCQRCRPLQLLIKPRQGNQRSEIFAFTGQFATVYKSLVDGRLNHVFNPVLALHAEGRQLQLLGIAAQQALPPGFQLTGQLQRQQPNHRPATLAIGLLCRIQQGQLDRVAAVYQRRIGCDLSTTLLDTFFLR